MLGSVYDAEDALQDALLRAWRGLPRFAARSSLRSWLYKITTNACLDVIARRPRRVLPLDYGPAADPHDGIGAPLAESVWIEPYPDERLDPGEQPLGPEARYELRESVELAFVAALQHLPANQRAALILREVLGFSAREVAESLDTTVASVNSALQRARKTIDDDVPDQSQQATLRELGDERIQELVEGYMDAMQRGDVEGVLALLSEDAAWSMPPLAAWFRGRERIDAFARMGAMAPEWRWLNLATTANGQPAAGAYCWHAGERAHLPFALNVFTLAGDRIADITSFIVRSTEWTDPERYLHWPAQPVDTELVAAYFARFGLPARLD
jgi:RNA polymerase sigma-70 factor (ECF subfamily)